MGKSFLKILSTLTLAGMVSVGVGIGIAQAQRGALSVTDRSGRQVINYGESHALVIWVKNYESPSWSNLNVGAI